VFHVKHSEVFSVWEELGVSGGTALIVLIALYFVIKWAVKNGIKEAHKEMNEDAATKLNEDLKL